MPDLDLNKKYTVSGYFVYKAAEELWKCGQDYYAVHLIAQVWGGDLQKAEEFCIDQWGPAPRGE